MKRLVLLVAFLVMFAMPTEARFCYPYGECGIWDVTTYGCLYGCSPCFRDDHYCCYFESGYCLEPDRMNWAVSFQQCNLGSCHD